MWRSIELVLVWFSVSTELGFVFVWVIEIDLISKWEIELNLFVVCRSKMCLF